MKAHLLLLFTFAFGLLGNDAIADQKPLKVFILVGQSNMQGHAHVRTFEHIRMDPQTASILHEIQDEDGAPRVCDDVWIASLSSGGEKQGQLTTGFGADENKIGPELTFGIYMQKIVDEPILIIKTAWGGKSLHTDFRPPSAGPYEFNQNQIEQFKMQNKNVEEIKANKEKATGLYYRLMIDHVKKVLNNIENVYTDYAPNQSYELAGIVWFQGWNDMVDRGTYPNRDKPGGYDQYSKILSHFIRDVRKDLNAPQLPFVIGVMGVGGPTKNYFPGELRYKGTHQNFRNAMAAPSALPEFRGNVTAVWTEKYWDPHLKELAAKWDEVRAKSRTLNQNKNLSSDERKKALDAFTAETFTEKELETFRTGTSNAAYHYLGSSKIMTQIGKGFAEELAKMIKKSRK